MENFTKGPWEVYDLGCYNDDDGRTQAQQLREDGGAFRCGVGLPAIAIIQSNDDCRRICTIDSHYSSDRKIELEEADALLIAAAPDMYEAIEAFIDESDTAGCSADLVDMFHKAYPKLKLALKKAKGE